MLDFLLVALLAGSCSVAGQQLQFSSDGRSVNSITTPGNALYYLMADAGTSVGPKDELRRSNRSLWKWLNPFTSNECCSNNNNNINNYPTAPQTTTLVPNSSSNYNGLQLQTWDPLKQLKWLNKLPELWGSTCGSNCGCSCGQSQPNNGYNYAPPAVPAYGGDGFDLPRPLPSAAPANYGPAPSSIYDAVPPNTVIDEPTTLYDGPGDGDGAYNPPPSSENYDGSLSSSSASDVEAPFQPNSESYVVPTPVSDYEAPSSPSYGPSPSDSPSGATGDYVPSAKGYGSAQPPQIVYQPIIYVSATVPAKQDYISQKSPQEAPAYVAPSQAAPDYVAPSQEAQPYMTPPQEAPAYVAPPQETPAYDAPEQPAYAAPSPSALYNAPACAGYLPLVGVPFYSYATPPCSSCQSNSAAPPPPPPATPTPAAPICAPSPSPSSPLPTAPTYVPQLSYDVSPCPSPIRLSLIDQPYRCAPELFAEYNYRMSLAAQNRL